MWRLRHRRAQGGGRRARRRPRAAARSGPARPAGPVSRARGGPAKNVDARLARALLASLPAAQRRLLLLRVVAGLSAEDTGYVLDMSPGAVRVAQHRALVRLRTLAAHEDHANRTGELGALGPGQPWSQ